MFSLLINKKTLILLSLVIQAFLMNNANAYYDIYFESIEIDDMHIYSPGDTIYMECCVVNRDTILNSCSIFIYAGDYFIGSGGYNSRIYPGDVKTFKIQCILPDDLPYGAYTICGIIQQKDNFPDNNTQFCDKHLYVEETSRDIPDVYIAMSDIVAFGDNFKPGDYISIQATVDNAGLFTAQDIEVNFYIDEYFIGNAYLSDMEPEQSETFDIQCHIPENMPNGYYTVKANVSCSHDQDSKNNEMETKTSLWIGYLYNIDLAVKAVKVERGTYIPKDMIDIYSLVENVGFKVSSKYTIDFYMSEDKNFTIRDYLIGHIERAALEPGEQHSYNTTFKLPPNLPASNYYVGVIVRSNGEDEMGNNSGYDNETIEIIHPANYVCGHITYEYKGQNDQDVRYALLKIIDSGTDRLIAETYTDENGNYGEVVLCDEASSNIYIKFYAESVSGAYPGTMSKICIVKDGTNQGWFSQKSPAYPHPQNLSRTIDYKTASRGFMVFDSMVEAFIQAKEYFGIEMDEITAFWPSSDNETYYIPSEGIFISKDDEWDRDIILHEYGHYIAKVYNFCMGSVGENSMHAWDVDLREFPVERTEEHAANLAFRESWPTLFSIASQYYNYSYPNSGDAKYQDYTYYNNISYELDLEKDTFDKGSPGEYYDNMNCCSLWDIFDDHPDNFSFNEQISDPNLNKIWNVIRSYKPENMNDFWVGWFHLYGQNEDKDGVIDIFQEHQMNFAKSGTLPVLPQNHAPVARAGQDITVSQDREEGAEVHLDASGSSDSDGDALSYIWRYGYLAYSGSKLDIVLPVGKTELEVEVTDGKITKWDRILVTVTATNPDTW